MSKIDVLFNIFVEIMEIFFQYLYKFQRKTSLYKNILQ